MTAPFKPMLACNADLSKLKFPLLASPKYDGIRCVVLDGKALTRNLKPIPNAYTRAWLEEYCDGLDGELVVGDPTAKDCFQRTTSAVMSRDGEPEVAFHVFDAVGGDADTGFTRRLNVAFHGVQAALAAGAAQLYGRSGPRSVPHQWAHDLDAINAYEEQRVAEGWEGVMLRDPNGLYKHGRSTVREGGLLKLKRFAQAEAVIVGFEERMHNDNVATVDALGHVERSTHAAGLRPAGDLGAFVVEMPDFSSRQDDYNPLVRFNVGGGFTAAQRVDFWERRESLLGHVVTFKFQEIGTKDAPRCPIFKGFRPEGA